MKKVIAIIILGLVWCNVVQALPECKGTDSSKWTNCFGTKSIKAEKKEPFAGIGIEIESKAGLLKLVSIMDNSPASKAGLKAGDYIIRIDGAEVNRKNLKDAVNMIRGAAGAPVEITIRRKGEKKVIVLKIVREIIQTKSTKTKGDYIYIGEFKDGEGHGQGTFTYPDGDKYVGQFKDAKLNGQGTYTYISGAKYVGRFKDGNYHGRGTYTFADGSIVKGIFKDGELIETQ